MPPKCGRITQSRRHLLLGARHELHALPLFEEGQFPIGSARMEPRVNCRCCRGSTRQRRSLGTNSPPAMDRLPLESCLVAALENQCIMLEAMTAR